MNKYLKVEGHSGFVRDKATGAIININSNEMAQARHRKHVWRQQQDEIKTLKDDVAEMKSLLMKVLEEKDG